MDKNFVDLIEIISKTIYSEEVEQGVLGLRPQFWSMRNGEWYHHFVGVACLRLSGNGHDIAHVPLLPMEYLWAPTEWIMADGPAGESPFIHLPLGLFGPELSFLRENYECFCHCTF